jgi:antitoxin (DNA-binding transcriptional repressor) of toxin-antitoxin stability system
MEVNIHDAKTHFSRLLERVEQSSSCAPISRSPGLSPNAGAKRELGWAAGEFQAPDDFDDPLPADVENSFYGR